MNIGELKKLIKNIENKTEIKIYKETSDFYDDVSDFLGFSFNSFYEDIDEENIGLVSFDEEDIPVFLISPIGKIAKM